MVGFGWWGCAKLWYNVRHEAVAQLQDQPVLLPDAACEVGLHRGCRRREESLFARQAVQDSAQGKGGDLCLTPPLLPHHWGQTLGVPSEFLDLIVSESGFQENRPLIISPGMGQVRVQNKIVYYSFCKLLS